MPDKSETADRDELIEAVREVARHVGTPTLSLAMFRGESGIAYERICRHFDGWADLCAAAGVRPARGELRIKDDDVFAAMRDAFVAMGGIGTRSRFDRHFRYSISVFTQRAGSWTAMLEAFRAWAARCAPDFPHMAQLEARIDRASLRKRPHAGDRPAAAPWPAHDGRVLGPRIDLPGLGHAPTNEHGVVLLFGILADRLGFMVEAVGQGFPDCEAKRRIGAGRWQRVRIEFEFLSRSFRAHGHDAAQCDLIVCWHDNWPDCPLEVLELRRAVEALAPPKPPGDVDHTADDGVGSPDAGDHRGGG